MKFIAKLRDLSDGTILEREMEFPDMNAAVEWMESQDEDPDRQYDVASIRLTPETN